MFVAPSAPTWAALADMDGSIFWERVHLWVCRTESWVHGEDEEYGDVFNSTVGGMTSYGPGIGYGPLGEVNQDELIGYFCHQDEECEEFKIVYKTWLGSRRRDAERAR